MSFRTLRLCGRFSLSSPLVSGTARPLCIFPPAQYRLASNTSAPRFAEGEDTQQLGSDTQTLQQQGWALDAEAMGVTKTFHFKSYFKAVVMWIRDSALARHN